MSPMPAPGGSGGHPRETRANRTGPARGSGPRGQAGYAGLRWGIDASRGLCLRAPDFLSGAIEGGRTEFHRYEAGFMRRWQRGMPRKAAESLVVVAREVLEAGVLVDEGELD
jgi:hypothetical protein